MLHGCGFTKQLCVLLVCREEDIAGYVCLHTVALCSCFVHQILLALQDGVRGLMFAMFANVTLQCSLKDGHCYGCASLMCFTAMLFCEAQQ